jgi:SAM-dependent methyltransferase
LALFEGLPTDELSEELFGVWRRSLGGWGIPEEILVAAPEEPWAFPTRLFAQRAHQQVLAPEGPSFVRADEALPDRGAVLDVGSGAGAASLPLGPRASLIVAVDRDTAMLAALAGMAASLPGVRVETVAGTWPEVAPRVPTVDVVVCHHVFYNAGDLRPFVEALTDHARSRVVAELTEHHPLEPMNPLWERFHGLVRPAGPTAEDAAAAIRSLGLPVVVERREAAPLHVYESFDEMVASHRRRLCLPATADAEVGAALIDLGVDPAHPVGLGGGRPLVTLWWDVP